MSKKVKKILLIGGSQGASDINHLYLKMSQNPVFKDIIFTLVTGEKKLTEIKSIAPRKQDKIVGFIQDMCSALLENDLIIARSGSGTVFEIISVRKPVIFLPYPYATHDHQRKNALYTENHGLAKIIDIRPFQVNKAMSLVQNSYQSDAIASMQKKLETHKIPLDAHQKIPEFILKQT